MVMHKVNDSIGTAKKPVSEGDSSSSWPSILSRFAWRDDGVMLVSLEDAADRDLTGREVISFMVMNESEEECARAAVAAGYRAASAANGAGKSIARLRSAPTW